MTDNLDAMEKMAWIDLVEKSNRTSPEEAPQMALISEEELGGYIRDAIATLRPQIAEATADRDEVARHRDVLHKQLAEAHAERDDYKKTAWEYHNDCARLRAAYAEACNESVDAYAKQCAAQRKVEMLIEALRPFCEIDTSEDGWGMKICDLEESGAVTRARAALKAAE